MENESPLQFGDVSQETDLYDEWLFSSTQRYEFVNMYETEKSTQAATWYDSAGSTCICVATNECTNNEVILYQLPKVIEDDSILSKDREIKIIAASSCAGPTNRLSLASDHFQNNGMLGRTEFGSTNIHLHTLPMTVDDSHIASLPLADTYTLYDDSSSPLPPVFQFCSTGHMIAAQTTSNIKLCDLQTRQTSDLSSTTDCANPMVSTVSANPTVSDIISAAPDYPDHQVFLCTSHGEISSLDSREHNSYCVKYMKSGMEENKSLTWRMTYWRDHQFLLANDCNSLSVIDLRNTKQPLIDCVLAAPPWTGKRNNHLFFIASYSQYASVSGKDNKLRIYDLASLEKHSDVTVEPVFIHDGHLPTWDCADMPVITTHNWRSKAPGVVSTTNTGQIHTWMFKL